MKVEDVMTRSVVTVHEDAPFHEIVEKLLAHDISGMPVVDDHGRVIGVVSESDLLAKEAFPRGHGRSPLAKLFVGTAEDEVQRDKALGLTASEIMTSRVVKTDPDEGLPAAARRMLEEGVKRMPVIRSGRLLGIITRHDVLRVFATSDADLARSVAEFLRRCMYVPPDHIIQTEASGGIVHLEGTVQYESDIRVVTSLVAALDGVVGVDSHLLYRMADPNGHGTKHKGVPTLS